MTTQCDGLAQISRGDGYVEVEFERELAHPVDVVWAALTRTAQLPLWLAPGTIELVRGGRARLDFVDSGIVIDSEVTQCTAEQLLEYSWSGPDEPRRPLTWALEPSAGGCRLKLTLDLPPGDDVARSCAGWEAHLEMLEAALEGVPIKFPFETFKARREAYKAQLAA